MSRQIAQALVFWLIGFLFKFLTDKVFEDHAMVDQFLSSIHASTEPRMEKQLPYSSTIHKNNDEGWGAIHVFFGNPAVSDYGEYGRSQVGQDNVVMQLLNHKRGGYFVDLAANHFVVFSNTNHLEKKLGWSGLCVEPNPKYWDGLLNRRCTVVAAVAGAERMKKVTFAMLPGQDGPGGGIVDGQHFDNTIDADGNVMTRGRKIVKKGDMKTMFTVPLREILDRFEVPKHFDYLSLDVEGAEYLVMKDFPFDQYSMKILTIERPKQELVDLLYQHGYVYLAAFNQFGDETLWALKSEVNQLNLTVVDAMLHKGNTTISRVPEDPLTEKLHV